MTFYTTANAQEFYATTLSNDIFQIEFSDSNNTANVTFLNRVYTPQGIILYDIAIVNNQFYGLGKDGEILAMDVTNQSSEIIGELPAGFYASLVSGGTNSLLAFNNITKQLYQFDLNTQNVTTIGQFDSENISDFSFYNGKLFYRAIGDKDLTAYDLETEESSNGFCVNNDSLGHVFGITTHYTSCESSRMFLADDSNRIYEVDVDNGDLYEIQLNDPSFNNSTIYGLASANEYQASNCGFMYTEASCEVLGTSSNSKIEFSVFPNPITDYITIQSETSIEAIQLYDINGKLVQQETLHTNENRINVQGLSSSVYLLKVKSNNNYQTTKVVKR